MEDLRTEPICNPREVLGSRHIQSDSSVDVRFCPIDGRVSCAVDNPLDVFPCDKTVKGPGVRNIDFAVRTYPGNSSGLEQPGDFVPEHPAAAHKPNHSTPRDELEVAAIFS